MITNEVEQLHTEARLKTFISRRERDVRRILAQLHRRRDAGFPFSTTDQMNKQTELRDVRVLLDLVDRQAPEMGTAHGDAIRYLLYRDIYERLELYLQYIQPRIHPNSRVRAFTP